jgi:predicted metal-dependent peptidase
MFTWKKGQRVEPKRTRCGGTDFTAPTTHAHKNMDKYDGYMILTDGFAAEPPKSRMRRVWVITPGGSLQFNAGKDIHVTMKANEKKEAA